METETQTIAVVMDGGIVQTVVADHPGFLHLDVIVIDYDTEGVEDESLSRIAQGDGSYVEAYTYSMPVEKAGICMTPIR